jgi:MSHA biogenesis protein MshJ
MKTPRDIASAFAKLNRRERVLVTGACLASIMLLGYTYAIEPALVERDKFRQLIVRHDDEVRRIGEQSALLAGRVEDPARATRDAIVQATRDTDALREQMRQQESRLVSPQAMDGILAGLLHRRPGIRVLSLSTRSDPPAGASARADAPGDDASHGLYRHDLRVEVEGSYAELTALMAEIDSSPTRLFREKAVLVAQGDGRCRLTLALFTLGLERSWLAL